MMPGYQVAYFFRNVTVTHPKKDSLSTLRAGSRIFGVLNLQVWERVKLSFLSHGFITVTTEQGSACFMGFKNLPSDGGLEQATGFRDRVMNQAISQRMSQF